MILIILALTREQALYLVDTAALARGKHFFLLDRFNALQEHSLAVFGQRSALLLQSLKSAHLIGTKGSSQKREVVLILRLECHDAIKHASVEFRHEILAGKLDLL